MLLLHSILMALSILVATVAFIPAFPVDAQQTQVPDDVCPTLGLPQQITVDDIIRLQPGAVALTAHQDDNDDARFAKNTWYMQLLRSQNATRGIFVAGSSVMTGTVTQHPATCTWRQLRNTIRQRKSELVADGGETYFYVYRSSWFEPIEPRGSYIDEVFNECREDLWTTFTLVPGDIVKPYDWMVREGLTPTLKHYPMFLVTQEGKNGNSQFTTVAYQGRYVSTKVGKVRPFSCASEEAETAVIVNREGTSEWLGVTSTTTYVEPEIWVKHVEATLFLPRAELAR